MRTNSNGKASRTDGNSDRASRRSSRINNSRGYSGTAKQAVKNPVPGDGGKKR